MINQIGVIVCGGVSMLMAFLAGLHLGITGISLLAMLSVGTAWVGWFTGDTLRGMAELIVVSACCLLGVAAFIWTALALIG